MKTAQTRLDETMRGPPRPQPLLRSGAVSSAQGAVLFA